MTQTFESGFKTTLALKLDPTDVTMTVATAPTVTSGRVFVKSGNTKEWIKYTGVSGTTLTGLVRGLSKTADPSTAGTGLSWLAGTQVVLVAMHDQLLDKNEPQESLQVAKTYATTTARDTALGADGAALYNYADIYCTDTGLFYNYNLSSNQWEVQGSGTATPNASTTAAGKVEIATSAETIAGTDTGGTGASVTALPSDIAANTQSGAFISGTAAGADTKTMTLTPTLTAYGKGVYVVTNTTVNTGAVTINIDGLGAKAVQTLEGGALIAGDMANTTTYILYYDGTQFKLCATVPANADRKGIAEMCSDAEATAATDEERYINAKQAKDNYGIVTDTINFTRVSDAATATVVYNHNLGKTPKQIHFKLISATNNSNPGWSEGSWSATTNVNRSVNWVYDAGNNSTSTAYCMLFGNAGTSAEQKGAVSAVSSTTFSITWTLVGSPATQTLLGIATLIA